MDSNYDRTALIRCCMLELCGVRIGLPFLPFFVLSTPVSESNFLGGVDFIVGLKGLNVVHYEGMSG